MGNFKKLLLGFILTMSTVSYAQQYKFGKVSKEELAETLYPLDSTANAVVLYESTKVNIQYNPANGFELITDVYKRVKIYNKKGLENATKKIFLYKNKSYKEEIRGIKGITYSLVNGEIVETKLAKDGIFKSEFSENYDQRKFTMPALLEGSIIEYKYKIISPFISNINRIYLQHEIPIKKLEVNIKTPEYYNYKKFVTGYLPIDLKESKESGKFTYRTDAKITARGRVKGTRQDIDYTNSVYDVKSNNVPAFNKEPFSGNVRNYISSIFFELSFVKFPNRPIERRSTTWEDVTKEIYSNTRFGAELQKNTYYKKDIDQLVDGINDPAKRADLIFDYVKQKMHWNKKRGVLTKKGVKKAYQEGTGNAAEINLMLTSMLDYAHIKANPVIASTSDRIISLFPTLDGFNYVVSRVKLPTGEMYYLDATDKYGKPNILPNRVLRGMGRVVEKKGVSQLVDFRPQKPSADKVRIQCKITSEGTVKGKLDVNHLDYLAHDFRVKNGDKEDKNNAKRFEKKYGINELTKYTVKGVKEYGKGVSERFSFVVEDQIEIIEDEIFFSPLLFLRDQENIFKSNERKYPIDYGFGFSNFYMVNIKIPEGYEVVECPKSGAFKLPENIGSFSYRSNVVNGTIQLVVNKIINAPMISAAQYPSIKEFYNQVIQKEGEQVVLKKI